MNRFSEIIESFSPLLQKILLNPEKKVRMIAANGVIMPQPTPSEFVTALFFLQYDQFDDIKTIAKERFFKIPEATFYEALKNPLHRFVLTGIFHSIIQQEKQSLSLFKNLISNKNIDFKIFLKKVDRLSIEIRSYLSEALSVIIKDIEFTAELLQTDISKSEKQKIIEFAIRNGVDLPIKNFELMKERLLHNTITQTTIENSTTQNTTPLNSLNQNISNNLTQNIVAHQENVETKQNIIQMTDKEIQERIKEKEVIKNLSWEEILENAEPQIKEILDHPKRLIMAKIKPMKPEEKVTLLYYLTFDPDLDISTDAKKTLFELPENILDASLLASNLLPHVLKEIISIFFQKNIFSKSRFEKVVFHKMFQFDLLQGKIELLSSEQIELISNNIQGLIQFPSVISEIYLAHNTPSSIAQRLLEFCFRHNIILTEIDNFDELKSEFQNEGKKERSKTTEKEIDDVMSKFIDPKFKESKQSSQKEESEDEDSEDDDFKVDLSEIDEAENIEEENSNTNVVEERKSLIRLISEMNIAEKIKLAMKGNMEARGILIKQSSRLVLEAVIRNPMVTDQEALRWSSDKNTAQEVIRFIANNKKWMRKSAIKMSILKHPKTPLGKAANLLEGLPLPELKSLSRVSGLSGNLKRLILDAISKKEKKAAKKK
ncbi:hypothetical protein JXR93_11660 [bacterium]|nr:hypothetical protein [bacterium]